MMQNVENKIVRT